ncbi:hypothetical protein AA313_de0206431 [Arthrobotrys entomopaga]|nr:hypothetical protein AA313_de0206431 [Arthrobotrys entomopaga]
MPYESIEDMNINGGKPYIWDPHDDPAVAGRRYYREPHQYALRHHDHRFEWTRAEFKKWGDDAAERFGYTVNYHGCGALYDGAHIFASRWRVEEALRRQIESQNIMLDPDGPLDAEIFREVFGHCSQVAIFIRNDLRKKFVERLSSVEERLFMRDLIAMDALVQNHTRLIKQSPSGFQCVKYHTFKKSSAEQPYPPTLTGLFNSQRLTIKHLLPTEVQRVWQYGDMSETKYDYTAVVIRTDLKTLWDSSFAVRRACRFHLNLFEHLALNHNPTCKLGQENSRGEPVNVEDLGKSDSNVDYRVLAMDLEPVRQYEFISASQKHTDSDSENEETKKFIQEPGLKIVASTPIIKVKVYWSTSASEGSSSTLEDAILNSEDLKNTPKDKILSLDEPVESMKEFQKRLKDGDPLLSATKITSSSVPIALIFIRPERSDGVTNQHDDFDYEKQKHDILGVVGREPTISWDQSSDLEETPDCTVDGFSNWEGHLGGSNDVPATSWDDW